MPDTNGENNTDLVDVTECPMCAEIIKKKAIKCRYCGHILHDLNFEHENDKKLNESKVVGQNHSFVPKKAISEWIIIASIVLILFSFLTPWQVSGFTDINYFGNVDINTVLGILVGLLYFIVMLVSKKEINHKFAIINSWLLVTYMITNLIRNISYSNYILYVGIGNYIALVGAISLLIGTFLIKNRGNKPSQKTDNYKTMTFNNISNGLITLSMVSSVVFLLDIYVIYMLTQNIFGPILWTYILGVPMAYNVVMRKYDCVEFAYVLPSAILLVICVLRYNPSIFSNLTKYNELDLPPLLGSITLACTILAYFVGAIMMAKTQNNVKNNY